jgi:hypothetical protein
LSTMSEPIKNLFDNLSHKFEIKRIVRLFAKDNVNDPIDDRLIAKWVEDFSVEQLDWRKRDMDISPLLEMAEHRKGSLRVLTLYTAGHWGIIYHWLSSDGLVAIPGVSWKTLVIHYCMTTKC